MSEQTNNETINDAFYTEFDHLIEVKNNNVLLTIHNDGTITAAEHLKPTETAAEVLRIMREIWMADAQSIKIRDQQEHIKRLEEAGDALGNNHNLFTFIDWLKAKEDKP
jgi:ArsR family metal-binding transcriptional regulator